VDDIAEAYLESWRQGLKAVAIYRDGSKGAQPLNVSDGNKAKAIKGASADETLNAAADRVLAAIATGKAALAEDVKTLEAKLAEKIEVTARGVSGAANAFTAALASLTEPGAEEQDQKAPPRAVRQASGGARVADAQVWDCRARGVHHGRALSQRPAGRDFYPHGEGRLDSCRADG
jgi:ribonucleoside-diphosphate reductase alpha chain